MNSITIATRESPLALWQAHFVEAELKRHHPGIEVKLLGMTSRGDQLLDKPLYKVGGKGCLLYTSPSPRDATLSRMPSSA